MNLGIQNFQVIQILRLYMYNLIVPPREKTNIVVQVTHKIICAAAEGGWARGMKFRIWEVERLYYPCSEKKGADQLRGYRDADLHLCFRIAKCLFSHEATQL